MGLKVAELNAALIEFYGQIGIVDTAAKIVHVGHELIAAANRGRNQLRQRLPDALQIAGKVHAVAMRSDGIDGRVPEPAEGGGALAGDALAANILDVARPEARIQPLHGRAGDHVLPPECHPHIQCGLMKQVHEEFRVFLVREIVRYFLRVFRQPHRFAAPLPLSSLRLSGKAAALPIQPIGISPRIGTLLEPWAEPAAKLPLAKKPP